MHHLKIYNIREINHLFPVFEMDVYIGQSSVTQHFRQILAFQHFSLFSCLAIILSSDSLLAFSPLVIQASLSLVFWQLFFHSFRLLSLNLPFVQSFVSKPFITQPSLQFDIFAVSLLYDQPSMYLAFYSFGLLCSQTYKPARLSSLSLPYNLTSLQLAFYTISLQCTQPSINLAFYTVRLTNHA